jgi:prepilin-type N-terminal cleavage/methylation domain-containing protein
MRPRVCPSGFNEHKGGPLIMRLQNKQSGFTIFELLIVIVVIAVLVAILIPSFHGMRREAQDDECRWKVDMLKSGVESYVRHHSDYPFTHPDDITYAIQHTKPAVINDIVKDPYETDHLTVPKTFGYQQSNDSQKKFYVVWSWGYNHQTEWSWNPDRTAPLEISIWPGADDLVASNIPVKKY